MKKLFIFALSLCIIGLAKAQVISTNVTSKLQLGSFTYYHLQGSSDDIYKTSAFPNDVLTLNQVVKLSYDADEDVFNIISPQLEHQSIANLISESSSVDEINWDEIDMPDYSNNMLHFSDSLHAVNFFTQIDDVFSQFDQTDFDSIALAFHSHYPNYVSFWMYLDDKYSSSPIDNDVFLALEKEEFIPDPVQQLLVSARRLVRIGDRVFFYNNLREIISTEADNYKAIDFLDSVSHIDDFDIYDPTSLILNNPNFELPYHYVNFPHNLLADPYGDGVQGDGDTHNTVKSTTTIGIDDPNQIRFRVIPLPDNNPIACDVETKRIKMAVWKGVRDYYDSNGDGQIDILDFYNWVETPYYLDVSHNPVLSINWDDGSSIEVVQNFYTYAYADHIYSNQGTYYPTTTLTFYSPEANQTLTFVDGTNASNSDAYDFYFINNGIECTKWEVARWNHKDIGDYRLRSKIWITNNFFGKHFGAYTECWKKKSNSSWKKKKADIITVNIEGTFRSSSSCIPEPEPKKGNSAKTNRKRAKKSKSNLYDYHRWAFGNEDIFSTHYLLENSNIIIHEMILNVCE